MEKEKVELEVDLVWRKKEDRRYGGGALAGRIITEKNLNVMTVQQMIRKGWNLEKKEDLEIIEIDQKSFIFHFRRSEDYKRVLRGRPWSISGWLLNIQQWDEDMVFSEVCFDWCPFWIQFQDLPPAALDIENTRRLGSKVGEVVMAEDPRRNGLLIRSFLIARVLVDLRKPLVTGMWSPREGKDPIWIKVRYERLQNLCFACGKLGHDLRSCPGFRDSESPVEAQYGNWLGVQAARKIDEAVVVCRDKWEEWDEMGGGKLTRNRPQIAAEGSSGGKNEGNASVEEDVKALRIERKEEAEKSDQKMKECKEVLQDITNLISEGGKEANVEKKRKKYVARKKESSSVVSPEKGKDMSKAMVVYGSVSPMSEVMESFKKVRLKRNALELEEKQDVKRRKLMFEAMEVGEKKEKGFVQGMGVRRSVRSIKKQSRCLGSVREGRKEDMKRGEDSKFDGVFTSSSGGTSVCMEATNDGLGGWPTATTKGL